MDLTDLLIIYFAAGAPFGVYRITTLDRTPNARSILNVALYICLWPVYLVLILSGRMLSKDRHTETASDRAIDDLRSAIERLAFADGAASDVFDFREIFNRYTGLCEAANAEISGSGPEELVEIGPAENKTLASTCLARRNREKLEFHQTSARNDFVDMISDLATERPEIMDIAIHVAGQVSDPDAVDDLKALAYRPTPSAAASPGPSSHAVRI